MKVLGYIAYEGPSEIDGAPIVVIINKIDNGSDNAKTGADFSICGDCAHRPITAKDTGAPPCYVNVGRSVRSVYEAYRRGRYVKANLETIALALAGKALRIGTYGDPAAAPVTIWQRVSRYVIARAGYSHQWQRDGFDHAAWAPLVMASADSIDDAALANLYGMRVFRVSVGVDKQSGEVTCPASAEGGKRATCADCMLCGGTSKQARDVVIADHAVGHDKRRTIMLAVA